jgi:hypothetical protein
MKFVLIGPGGSTIPPNGWGAVESIVWDYYQELTKRGHKVVILTDSYFWNIVNNTNNENPDIVYVMYDDYIHIVPHIKCKRIFYMSHYAYITHPNFEEREQSYFNGIFKKVIEYQRFITLNAISAKVLAVYHRYGYTGKSNIIHNGARGDLFNYDENIQFPDKSIYVGKIENRKAQFKYQNIDGIEFAGNFYNSSFNTNASNYLGEWTKPVLYENLTKYANLVLLSDGEADPLVVKEALVAGLGVVVSECASANLDRIKPFITIIPDDKLNDIPFVTEKIIINRFISGKLRCQIRKYGLTEFSWSNIVDKFLENIPLKIALIGPGIMPIPPPGWGAVEILIWDYYQELTRLGHKVDIINIPNKEEIVKRVNEGNYDFTHLHYDVFWNILDRLNCPKIAITSHYPYIDQPEKHWGDGYHEVFKGICNNSNHSIFALSKKDYDMFHKYAINKSNIYLTLNGSNSEEIEPVENCGFVNKSIYIGKIEQRKQQHKYCGIPNIDFYGRCDDDSFRQKECYKGEPPRNELINLLKNYGNLVLLSRGENGTPLVIKEALMAGLPVVTNRFSSDDLDLDLPFIDIIPDDKLDDLEYINSVVEENRKKQIYKNQIREYANKEFAWKGLVKKYNNIIIKI